MHLYFDISYLSFFLSFISTVPYLATVHMVWEYDKRKEDSSTGTGSSSSSSSSRYRFIQRGRRSMLCSRLGETLTCLLALLACVNKMMDPI